jgi:phospholipid/cholesterol/gamma-HCH transport system substrate-binding protein
VVKGLGERDQAIGRLIDNLEVVARTVADRDAQIEAMLDNLASLSQTFSDNTELLRTALVEVGSFNRDLSGVLAANRGEIDRLLANLDATLGTVEAELGPLATALDNLDENAASTFRSSSDGTFLNQTILCFTVTAPPCPTPVVPGLDPVTGQSAGRAAVPYSSRHRSGSDAVLSIVGGER